MRFTRSLGQQRTTISREKYWFVFMVKGLRFSSTGKMKSARLRQSPNTVRDRGFSAGSELEGLRSSFMPGYVKKMQSLLCSFYLQLSPLVCTSLISLVFYITFNILLVNYMKTAWCSFFLKLTSHEWNISLSIYTIDDLSFYINFYASFTFSVCSLFSKIYRAIKFLLYHDGIGIFTLFMLYFCFLLFFFFNINKAISSFSFSWLFFWWFIFYVNILSYCS